MQSVKVHAIRLPVGVPLMVSERHPPRSPSTRAGLMLAEQCQRLPHAMGVTVCLRNIPGVWEHRWGLGAGQAALCSSDGALRRPGSVLVGTPGAQ